MENQKSIDKLFGNFFEKYSNGRIILALFVLNIIFPAVVFPLFQGDTANVPLDLQFSYSPEKAYQLLAQYSVQELKMYRILELTGDVIYPIVYGFFLSLLIFKFRKNSLLVLIPLLAIVADLFENTGIVILISSLPKQLNTVASITSIFSSLKWSLIVISILLIVIFGVQRLFLNKKAN